MKKYIFIFILFSFLFQSYQADAQIYQRRGQTIYLEFGGPAIQYSLNYEARFLRRTEGSGLRFGIGYTGNAAAIPVHLNWLIGKKHKASFLEIGAGFTYFNYSNPEDFGGKLISKQIAASFTIMYRIHARYRKGVFKIGLTPSYGYFDEEKAEKIFYPWFGIAFGRAF